tara:strand:+ start:3266 stop:5089 length:1824 start_codon:yes stop_codon:yes gene_type:complete
LGLEQLKSVFQDQLSDRADEFTTQTNQNFMEQTPIFDSLTRSSVINFTTVTNTSPAFPQTYSPLNEIINGEFTQGTGDSLQNHSWTDLYNKNHTSKDISNPSPRSQNPYQRFNYGNSNVNQNLDIKSNVNSFLNIPMRDSVISGVGKLINNLNFLDSNIIGGFGDFLQDMGKEPYIVSNLPTTNDFGINGRLTNAGGRLIPLARPLVDTLRIAKYLTSPQGIANILAKNAHLIVPDTVVKNQKEDGLIRVPQRFNAGYNPLSTLIAAGGRVLGQGLPNFAATTGFTGEYGAPITADMDFNPIDIELRQGYIPTPEDKINNTFTGATYDIDGEDGDGNVGITGNKLKNFLGKIGIGGQPVTPTSTGDKMTLAPMIKGEKLNVTNTDTEAELGTTKKSFNASIDNEKEGMPLYFKDLRDNTYIFFRAYLEGITEDISPSWSETNYVGRSEPVYVYERATRTINFSLKLMAHTKKELDAIWKKMNRLTSLAYPEYAKDELLSEYLSSTDSDGNVTNSVSKTRMKPPLTKFRLGDMFGTTNNELLGFIDSISYSIPEGSTWETKNKKRIPKHIMATLTYKVIHGEVPGLYNQKGEEYSFYGAVPPKPVNGG